MLKEWRCEFHSEFENASGVCPACGNNHFVKREIRTAPAYHNGRTRAADTTLRMIADDAGLTDLKNDPKAGVSVLQAMQKTGDVNTPRWLDVPHAAPGFSRTGAAAPVFKGESAGFQPSAATGMKLPKPDGGYFNNPLARTRVMGVHKE